MTPGDVHDSQPYLKQLEYVNKNVVSIKAAAADSAYDFPLAHRVLEEMLIGFFVVPQPTHDCIKAELKRDVFTDDEQRDIYVCPNGKMLRHKRLYHSASGLFWEYWAEKKDCCSCPLQQKCLNETDKAGARKLQDSHFKTVVQQHFSSRRQPEYREALKQRQICCEGTFAAQKWGHSLTRVLRRGLEAAEDHCLLSAAALNLKRMIRCLS